MEFLPIIYLGYMFVSIYFLSLFILIYKKNKKKVFDFPKVDKSPPVSFVVPAWNEGETIADSIHHIFESYDNISDVVIVNDCSTDNTREVVESLKKKYPKLILINNKKNCGNAAGSQNIGLKYVKAEFVAIADADSFPEKNSINKMIGYLLEDDSVGAVTCKVVARNKKTFFERLQAVEYSVIAFVRKLLDYVDAIYVTPGPLALYRKSALDKIGGFDTKNMTQDIEATWHLAYEGYHRRMCLGTFVTTTVPDKIKPWYKQRRRWNIGGLQCIAKYKGIFLKRGMLGFFILPFFVLQLFLGVIGLSIFFYLTTTRILSNYIFAKYSISVGTPLLTMNDFLITPSFLNYLGVILFVAGAFFTFMVLGIIDINLRKHNIFNVLFYLVVYLSVYPFIMISAIYNFLKGGASWR